MKEIFCTGHTLPEAYHKAILALHSEGDILPCSDWNQNQKEISVTFVVEAPLAEPRVSRLYVGGFKELQQYVMEIVDGLLDFRVGSGFEYTYHDRMARYPILPESQPQAVTRFDQIDFVIRELKRNSDSRRAVIDIRDNSVDAFSSDCACLQNMQFFIRNEALHCKVLMRSNDAVEATFMNAFAFIMLQEHIAGELDVAVGTYAHRANSFHCYEKDFKLLEQYAKGIREKKPEELTYDYEDYYKELMEENIPAIMGMIDTLKKQPG
ncbi:MAG: thymidylate synthase [Peptococcaceae bacterium]|jgi:thymidylate synthase|nr:thymidylate synthase [Peptococcaceae bacterium]